jgi:hypothetical protein
MNKLFLLSVLTLCSCSKKQDQKLTLLDVITENRDGTTVEFPYLYTELVNELPEDEDENLILVEKLKMKGFKVTNWSRGNNPPLGPRIVDVRLRNKNCECEVAKIYYYTISDSSFLRSERIRCYTASR